MPTRLLLIHFTPPGVIGGVEHIMHQHIQILQARGFQIEVVAGRDGNHDAPVHLLPEIDPASPEGQLIEAELARGEVGERFYAANRSIEAILRPLVERADFVITHNAYTLHFSLPLTAVLWDLGAQQPPGKMIAWCHDLAWTNPLYLPILHEDYPWSLLREPAPRTTYITVSEERRKELLGLWGDGRSPVTVVPNGIDLLALWRFSPLARHIVERFRLLDCDLVMLLPVRITRRKNVETAIRAVRALKDRGLAVRFLASAPPASDHPGLSNGYLGSLKDLRRDLGVEEEVVFLADALGHSLEMETVAELYQVTDVLLFPSTQEGFGLPILEAGAMRVPVVLSDIPIFREVGADDASFFGLQDPPESIAGRILAALAGRSSRLYRRVLHDYRWEAIVDRKILPLLEQGAAVDSPPELEGPAPIYSMPRTITTSTQRPAIPAIMPEEVMTPPAPNTPTTAAMSTAPAKAAR